MNHHRLQLFLFSLLSLVATPIFADETKSILPEKEEDIPVEFIPTLDTTVSVGFRRMNSGPKVRFGNLGNLSEPTLVNPYDTTHGYKSHYYTDGVVYSDGPSGYELNSLAGSIGGVFSTPSYKVVRTDNNSVITVYTMVPTARTDGDGFTGANLLTNTDGTYIPNMGPGDSTDGTPSATFGTRFAATTRFLASQGNQTRSWSALNKSQIREDTTSGKYYVDMHADSVMTAGASLEANSAASSGFDISIERRLGKRGKIDWGVSAGVKFAFINAKANGAFAANLLRKTDSYELNTTHSPRDLNGNIVIDQTQPGGSVKNLDLFLYQADGLGTAKVFRYSDTSTAPLNYTAGADSSYGTTIYTGIDGDGKDDLAHMPIPGDTLIAGPVTIHGDYSLKGAYLLSHIGPTFRYNFNDRWAVSGTVALALGWIGTNFKATEWYNTWSDLPGNEAERSLGRPNGLRPDYADNTTEYHWSESNSTHKFRPGIYYDLNIEYWVTDRTGFYAGVTGQHMRDFTNRRLGDRADPRDKTNTKIIEGRTATVDFGQGTGWTVGIRTRF